MSGITDIKNAFAKAAPGIDLRAVRMRYDHDASEQVFEFDICRADGAKQTVEERIPAGVMTPQMIEMARKVATAIGAKVDLQDNTPSQAIPLAEKAAEGIAQIVSVSEPVSAPVEIEHQGEKYELAHDGSPQTLFF